MRFLKLVVVPVVILGVALIVTMGVYSDLPNSSKIMLAPLLAEASILLYFWKYQLTKDSKSRLFFVYMTFLVMLVFIVKIFVTYLYSAGIIPWSPYAYIYFGFVGLIVVMGWILKLLYGGVNKSIAMQNKGEDNLSRMKEICHEIIFELQQNKRETTKQVRIMKQVIDALDYSDPVTHKKVIPMEKAIIGKLEATLSQAKKKHFDKIKEITKGSQGVLHLIKERNEALRDRK